eukprot:Platyproteum_vivax@DN4855_c0_g1_i2.p1
MVGFVPEVHFIGELEFCEWKSDSVELDPLYCEFCLDYGSGWTPLCSAADKAQQTQTSKPNAEAKYIWSHPLDYYLASTTPTAPGWPRLRMSICKFTDLGSINLVSYGALSLPTTPGHHKLTCNTWSPVANYLTTVENTLLGQSCSVVNNDIIAMAPDERLNLVTSSSCNVVASVDVIFRNFDIHMLNNLS